MTGTKNRTALDFGSFDHRSPSFGPPSLNSEGRSGYVSVIPNAFLSFRRTRTSCRSVSFLNKTTWKRENFSFLGHSILKISTCLVLWNNTRMKMEWHWNDDGMTIEWHWNDNGITLEWQRNNIGLTTKGHWNDIGMTLNWPPPPLCQQCAIIQSHVNDLGMTIEWQENDVRMRKIVFWITLEWCQNDNIGCVKNGCIWR